MFDLAENAFSIELDLGRDIPVRRDRRERLAEALLLPSSDVVGVLLALEEIA